MLNPLSRLQSVPSKLPSIDFASAFSYLFLPLTLLIIALGATWLPKASAQNASTGQEPTTQEVSLLELGKSIERELTGGQSHDYQIDLKSNQYLHVVTTQRGIDVVVLLFGPEDSQIEEIDSPNGARGPEVLKVITNLPGKYRIRISPMEEQAKSGKYEIRVAELRPANKNDSPLVEAFKLLNQAKTLTSERKFDEAIPLTERVIALRESVLGDQSLEVAEAIIQLAVIFDSKIDNEKAEPLYLRGLAIKEAD